MNSKSRPEEMNWEFPGFQWLGLGTLTARVLGSIPGWGTKVLQATRGAAEKEKKKKEK